MPHVTFIHGISNKPVKDKLLQEWEAHLVQGGLDLAAQGVTTSMVYWADVMYAEPLNDESDFESVDGELGTGVGDDDLGWIDQLPDSEKAFAESFREKLGIEKLSPGGEDYLPTSDFMQKFDEYSFEAIPLPCNGIHLRN